MTDKRLTNNLRAELYKLLFPKIIEEDQKYGVESFINYWDDPLLKWDEGALWDELGIVPVIKNFFFAIEMEETKDLEYIDRLTDLVDPDRAIFLQQHHLSFCQLACFVHQLNIQSMFHLALKLRSGCRNYHSCTRSYLYQLFCLLSCR